MKALALLPLILLLISGCATATPARNHKVQRPVKKVIIVAPSRVITRPVTKTVIIKRATPYRPAVTRIIKSEAPSFTTTIRKS